MKVSIHLCLWGVLATMWTFVVDVRAASTPPFAPEDVEFFERRVRPILVQQCYECHSRESSSIEGGFVLDQRQSVLQGGDSGPGVVVGQPSRSRLIRAVRYKDETLQMPPGRRLPSRDIQILEEWVRRGLPWGDVSSDALPANPVRRMGLLRESHWAFRPIRKPSLPVVRLSRHPIDRFVDARLAPNALKRQPIAASHTRVRRAFLDLIGLPPTFDQVQSFAGDKNPDAWQRLIDRLLSDPRYGRRWGRHWLDVARYADTKGYVDAGEPRFPFAYTYRDYVIDSLNGDLPFDRFVLEQIAADRLPDRSRPSLAALGYLTVGSRYNFFPHEIVDDRIDVITRGFMGLTVTCARCHDHKFDPISTTDYYRLYSILASSREVMPHEMPRIEVSERCHPDFARQLADKVKLLVDHREHLHQQIMHEMRAWSGDYLVYIVQLMPEHRTQSQPGLRTDRGLIREVTAYGPGGVGRWRRYIAACGRDGPVFGLWNRLVALPRESFAARAPSEIDKFAVQTHANPLIIQAFRSSPPIDMVATAKLYGRLLEQTEKDWQELRQRDPNARAFRDPPREQLRQALYGPGTPPTLTLDESEQLYHLDDHTEVRKRFADVERVFLAVPGKETRAMALADRETPIDVRVFRRGDPEQLGDLAPRGFLELFPSIVSANEFRNDSGRHALARAIVHPSNPLTARVIVNRVWRWHFGAGLVPTPSDFGTRSQPPSHPRLLDWLAADLIEHDWSLKHLHRRIMSSQTYQQQSRDHVEARAIDPANRLLWRFHRRRLEFEPMRDSMLFVAGCLADHSGGPAVDADFDDPTNRLPSIFCLLDRELLPGLLRDFDFPSPDISNPQRSQSTAPQQSLFLLNSPFVITRAKEIVARAAGSSSDMSDQARVVYLYRTVFARDPDEFELAASRRYVRAERDSPAQGTTDDPATGLSPWEKLAHALLQTNEFLFLE